MKATNLLQRAQLVVMGAVCGDIIGSAFEFHPTKSLDFPFFKTRSTFTDDTVCTVAVAQSLITDFPLTETLQGWCRRYPHAGYGGHFHSWIYLDQPYPYNSWGNGSAMRVSPVGAFARNLNETMTLAKASADVTHNHPEGVKGAQATATAIFYALRGATKEEIKAIIEKGFGYDLSRRYDLIKQGYSFDVSCQGSVPESIICFLQSHDYESTIRHAVAMGGDADTMGAIAGGIAAAYYAEIPDHILNECYSRLDDPLREMITKFNNALSVRYGE